MMMLASSSTKMFATKYCEVRRAGLALTLARYHAGRRQLGGLGVVSMAKNGGVGISQEPRSFSHHQKQHNNTIITYSPALLLPSSTGSMLSSAPFISSPIDQQHHHQHQSRFSTSSSSGLKESYEHILVDIKGEGTSQVGLVTLNRPKALNALCDALFDDLIHACTVLNEMESIGCVVITGSEKAFAAGADIAEMSTREFSYAYKTNMFARWSEIKSLPKPTIAAVNGFALGGGCELAMMCDIIVAGSKAKFGQPEINLGVIPGAGGTQHLVRAIGKSKAMDMILTGRHISADQAEAYGLVSAVYPPEELVDKALGMAKTIASKGRISVMMAKEAVNASEELTLEEGLRFERRLFHSLFATNDQKEGMDAFLNKRKPDFTHT